TTPKHVNYLSNYHKSILNTTVSFDDKRRTQLFLQDQIPKRIAYGGYLLLAAVSTATLPHIFPQLRWYYVLVAYVFALPLTFCNAYDAGLIDWSLASTYRKLAIFAIGGWAGAAHDDVLAGLAACGVMINIVSTASDLMQDFKTGYLTLALPRSMFINQVIGTAMGCIIVPSVFWLFLKAFDDIGIPGSEYPAPNAFVYRNMAILGVEGFSSDFLEPSTNFFLGLAQEEREEERGTGEALPAQVHGSRKPVENTSRVSQHLLRRTHGTNRNNKKKVRMDARNSQVYL
ncbi:hypothetical protein BHM03_00056724, partial [Ensete ventricosum]